MKGKIPDDMAYDIMELHMQGLTYKELAEKFNVSYYSICQLKRRKLKVPVDWDKVKVPFISIRK